MADDQQGAQSANATPAGAVETNQTVQGQQSAPWQGTFKTADDLWNGYTNLKSAYDKLQSNVHQGKGQQSQQAQQSQGFSLEGFGARVDSELASGKFSDDTSRILSQMGVDPSFLQEFYGYRAQKQFEPLKQYLGDVDLGQTLNTLNQTLDDNKRSLFRYALEAGEYEAAAAVAKAAMAQANAQPKVGQTATGTGAGYKDFKELNAAMKDQRFEWDKEYQADVKRKFEATHPSIIEQWQKQYSGF